MVTYHPHPQDGDTQSLGWSPTINDMVPNLPEDGNSFSKDGHQLSPGWSPTIPSRVTHHPKFCPPPRRGRLPPIIGRVTVLRIWSKIYLILKLLEVSWNWIRYDHGLAAVLKHPNFSEKVFQIICCGEEQEFFSDSRISSPDQTG